MKKGFLLKNPITLQNARILKHRPIQGDFASANLILYLKNSILLYSFIAENSKRTDFVDIQSLSQREGLSPRKITQQAELFSLEQNYTDDHVTQD